MKPILFNTEMVKAIIDDRKTVTRRIVKPQPPDNDPHNSCLLYIENGIAHFGMRNRTPHLVKLPYSPGDVLYVRETWAAWSPTYGTAPEIIYKADGYSQSHKMKWRPSIHMPREAARIFLRVTDVRVERVQDIAYADIIRDGITEEDIDEREAINREASSKDLYSRLWNSTVKPDDLPLYGWDANPWVWVIEFERITKEEATNCDCGVRNTP